jgi:hypothetical protein
VTAPAQRCHRFIVKLQLLALLADEVAPDFGHPGYAAILPDAQPDTDARWGTKLVAGSSQVLPMSAIQSSKRTADL